MVKSISAKYGPPTYVALAIDSATNDRYDVTQKPVASWADAQYSFNLVRSSFSDHLGLIIYSKRVNTEAELAIVEAVKLDAQEGPQREAERQKKQTDERAGRPAKRSRASEKANGRPRSGAPEESEDFSPVASAWSHKKLIIRAWIRPHRGAPPLLTFFVMASCPIQMSHCSRTFP